MAVPVIMPRQGLSVESCILTEWCKDVGDRVAEGDIIFCFETDKASFEKEAEGEGILLEKFFAEGDEVPVLVNVAVLGEEGEDPEPFRPDAAGTAPVPAGDAQVHEKPASEAGAGSAGDMAAGAGGPARTGVSPRALNLASRYNVDWRHASPTGPGGRVIADDIRTLLETGTVFTPAAMAQYDRTKMSLSGREKGAGPGGKITLADLEGLAGGPAQPAGADRMDYRELPLSSIRRKIGLAMHRSLQSSAQLTLNASFDAGAILDYRARVKSGEAGSGPADATITDVIAFVVARTLKDHEFLNAHLVDDTMRLFRGVHLGVAVDTERGLMVPTVFDADSKSLADISAELKARAEECRKGAINPDYLQGATFTVTNLGMLGVESFTPVLNPPQTGILGVCSVVQRVRETGEGCSYYPAMGLSLTFDHRALDGAPAAVFLRDVKGRLESLQLI